MLGPVSAWTFWWPATGILAGAVALGVPLYAWRQRGRPYAVAALIILGLSFPAAWWVFAATSQEFPGAQVALGAAWTYGFATAGVHLASLAKARLRPRWFRWGISIPGMAFVAAGTLALPWLVVWWPARALGVVASVPVLEWLTPFPFYVALLSIPTSLGVRREFVRVDLDAPKPEEFARAKLVRRRRAPRSVQPAGLRIVQIADPHLGPWMPVHRLRRRIEALLAHRPDLVLLTGDFLTMEGRGSPGALAESLAPLRAAAGRCVAILGNHDHEALGEVRAALAANGVALLVDAERCVETAWGPVQIVGSDWVGRRAGEHLRALLAHYPRRPGHLRLLLLHDPSGFPTIPAGEVDLTLSGHTHGGQLGLLNLGISWTVLTRSRWPDHGLFARGSNHLYVHRGTGFYGFPLRVGVPGEASLLEVVGSGLVNAVSAVDRRNAAAGSPA